MRNADLIRDEATGLVTIHNPHMKGHLPKSRLIVPVKALQTVASAQTGIVGEIGRVPSGVRRDA
jgi:hypothetical protein